MEVEQQQGTWTQLSLFEIEEGSVRPSASGEGGTGSAALEEWQASTALTRERALTGDLMERVSERENLNRAYKRVKANKGAPGIDGMAVRGLYDWLKEHKEEVVASLLEGSYKPQPVLGKEIEKPGGGKQRLGIPTVVDRLAQQAILQVLEGLVEPTFSESSYGFRRGRNAHQAVKQAAKYVAEGWGVVVDIDLEKFFERVNHDMLMARLARHVRDKRLLRIIRRFLEAGMMWDGVCLERYEGTPQGATIAIASQSAARRPRQGTGAPGTPLLPIRGRLQHLRTDGEGRRAGYGFGDSVPGERAPVASEPGKECGGACPRATVPGIPDTVGWSATYRSPES